MLSPSALSDEVDVIVLEKFSRSYIKKLKPPAQMLQLNDRELERRRRRLSVLAFKEKSGRQQLMLSCFAVNCQRVFEV